MFKSKQRKWVDGKSLEHELKRDSFKSSCGENLSKKNKKTSPRIPINWLEMEANTTSGEGN